MKKHKRLISLMATICLVVLTLTVSVSATGSSGGTMASAITSIGEALTGVIGYMAQTTAALLGDDLWLLGMGFFVLSFIAGFVIYLFQAGRR